MKIVLTTINARYSHTSFGLRYLKANLKEFESLTEICEFSLDESITEIAEKLIARQPEIIGFGCYIWNIESILRVAEIVRAILPQTLIVFGGPEVSYENEEFLPYCDYLIEGEGELVWYDLAKGYVSGNLPQDQILKKPVCDLTQLKMPYYLYSEEDIANRLVYVEATRGCPFSCEFCLSSLSRGVREFDLDLFLSNMKMLIDKGVWQFKFVDRTFNLKIDNISKILNFFKANWRENMYLHFEIFPDRLNAEMLAEIQNFPKGGLHLEAGVQSFFEPSLQAISRKQNEQKTLANLRFIREQTGAEIHADLVAGLPYSTFQTFKEDFDKLMSIRPQELQLGILKRLRGAPIDRHTEDLQMVYSKYPPYEIMQNRDMDYGALQRIKRIARYLDIFYNARNFPKTAEMLLCSQQSAFDAMDEFSQFIWKNYQQTHKISIGRQTRILFDYLQKYYSPQEIAKVLLEDYYAKNRKDNVIYLKEII